MTNKISNRHHYLPRFYIKNFCNSDGKLFVNDKLNKSNYDNICVKVPKSIFFDWDRNTFSFNGTDTDQLEKLYSSLDSDMAIIIDRLIKDEALEGNKMQVETLRKLIHFGYLTKWRVPQIDDYFASLKREISFGELNLYGGINDQMIDLESIFEDKASQEFKRVLFSGLLFKDQEQYKEVFKNSFILSFKKPLFVTDNPFVELSIDKEKEYPSFIFPITSNLLLIHCDFIEKDQFLKHMIVNAHYEKFIDTFYNSVQITLMWHAKKYIGCASKESLAYYLSVVSEISEKLDDNAPFVAFNILKHYEKIQ